MVCRYCQRIIISLLPLVVSPLAAAEGFVPWQAVGDSIPQPLGGLTGDASRGREIARRKDLGNCLACHRLPMPEAGFQGTVGPPLDGIASRLNAGQIRLRVADESRRVPTTVMPPFHKDPTTLNQVADDYYGKPVLNAQQLEDVVAYLMTLQ